MKLHELINSVDKNVVFQHIADKDKQELEIVKKAYTNVIEDLLAKTPKESPYPIFVETAKDDFDKSDYIHVCYINNNYIDPLGLIPYGAEIDKIVPEGHYNANDEKYSKYLGFGFSPWDEVAGTEVTFNENFSPEILVAEILWELTFYGFKESESQAFAEKLSRDVEDIKSGKVKTVPINLDEFLKDLEVQDEKPANPESAI